MLRPPRRRRARVVSSFHPLRNAAASETRYDADPQRPDRRRRRRSAAAGAEILAIYHSHPRWAADPQPDRPPREPLRRRPPDHRLAARRRRPRSASGGSTPTRTRNSPGGSCADGPRPSPLNRAAPRRLNYRLAISEGLNRAKNFGRRRRSPARRSVPHATHPDHLQARLRPAPAGRPDPPAVRGQGPADRRPEAHPGRPRASARSTTPSTRASRSSTA